ncbi:MAG: aldo/keto reductase [Oceanospirillaceae bacterium]|nr:aldo/keto reductase [Oceanospirillaceae bacterium]
MQRIELGKQGASLSRLIYGVWRLADGGETDTSTVRAKIDACLEQGITSFDHADIYGDYECERVFGETLKEQPSLRDSMELISKCDIALISDKFPQRRVKYYDTTESYIHTSVENSLRHLHTDHLDLLLIHRPDPLMDAAETGAALDKLVESGKVKQIGVSNFHVWDWKLLQQHMTSKLVVNQIEMSLVQRESFTDGTLSAMQLDQMSAMAWSPLGGGSLFGNSEAAARLAPIFRRIESEQGFSADLVALAWLLAHPAKILPVVGTNNLARIRDIAKALEVELDRETWFELWTAAAGQEVP